jgi:PEGA domain
MKNIVTACLVACAFFTCSCATLFQGTNEEIMVASDPSGAQVTVNDGRSGVTPYSMRINRNEDLQIHVSKIGYTPYDEADASHIEWGYFVSDLFFTGLIGLAVDGIDGAMFYHNQAMVTAHLDPVQSAAPTVGQASDAKAPAVAALAIPTSIQPVSATTSPAPTAA